MSDSVYTVKISVNHAGQRLDNYLIKHLKGVPKSHLYRIIRKGEIRVNRKRCKAHQRLLLGDEVRIPPLRVSQKQTVHPSQSAQALILDNILFEDEHMLVLNKPAGWAVHRGSGNAIGIIELLKAAKPHTPFLELIHRLDKDTSGCLMIAKSREALTSLHGSLRQHDGNLKKTYLALLKGQWPYATKTVDLALDVVRNSDHFKTTKVDQQGHSARSEFKASKVFANCSLMNVVILTGRMHQIRVHAAHLGYPLVGDRKYGDFAYNRQFTKQFGLNRIFLHASKLRFTHPVSHQKVACFAPLPEALKRVLTTLQTGSRDSNT